MSRITAAECSVSKITDAPGNKSSPSPPAQPFRYTLRVANAARRLLCFVRTRRCGRHLHLSRPLRGSSLHRAGVPHHPRAVLRRLHLGHVRRQRQAEHRADDAPMLHGRHGRQRHRLRQVRQLLHVRAGLFALSRAAQGLLGVGLSECSWHDKRRPHLQLPELQRSAYHADCSHA